MSSKFGTATLAAIAFLLGGVEVAQAGGIADVVPAVAETALPKPEDATPGDIVEEATQVVDEVTDAVDQAAGPVDADALVSTVEEAVDEAVADPRGTVENTVGTVETTVEQASSTVNGVAGDAGKLVGSSPVRKAARGISDIVNPVASGAAPSEATHSESADPAPSRQESQTAPPRDSRALKGSQVRAAPGHTTWRATAPRVVVGPIVTVPDGAVQQPLLSRRSLSLPSATWKDAFSAPEPGPAAASEASSAAPAAPFAPRAPGDQPATAASVAGAAGAALLAALFSAFLFLAPRNGRPARAGPILLRPEPCLSLAERPG